jgi:hypothetical protein
MCLLYAVYMISNKHQNNVIASLFNNIQMNAREDMNLGHYDMTIYVRTLDSIHTTFKHLRSKGRHIHAYEMQVQFSNCFQQNYVPAYAHIFIYLKKTRRSVKLLLYKAVEAYRVVTCLGSHTV